jgi:hypothetical protein
LIFGLNSNSELITQDFDLLFTVHGTWFIVHSSLSKRYLKIPVDAKEKTKKPSKELFEGIEVLIQGETVETVLQEG